MTQEHEVETMPDEAYSDEFCSDEEILVLGERDSSVYSQVVCNLEIHCCVHNISMEQLATMAHVPLERLQAFCKDRPTLSLQEWIKITDALGFKDYFTVGRKEKNRIIKKNSSLKVLTELIQKAQFDISLLEYARLLDLVDFGKFAIILFPPIPEESLAYYRELRKDFRKDLRKKRKPIRSESLRRYYES